jgi:hypothetical protein
VIGPFAQLWGRNVRVAVLRSVGDRVTSLCVWTLCSTVVDWGGWLVPWGTTDLGEDSPTLERRLWVCSLGNCGVLGDGLLWNLLRGVSGLHKGLSSGARFRPDRNNNKEICTYFVVIFRYCIGYMWMRFSWYNVSLYIGYLYWVACKSFYLYIMFTIVTLCIVRLSDCWFQVFISFLCLWPLLYLLFLLITFHIWYVLLVLFLDLTVSLMSLRLEARRPKQLMAR